MSSKVLAIGGDITQDGLGLSPQDAAFVAAEVQVRLYDHPVAWTHECGDCEKEYTGWNGIFGLQHMYRQGVPFYP